MSEATPIMAGKRGLIMGVANDRSLAWGIAKKVAEHGAELAFTYHVRRWKNGFGRSLNRSNRPMLCLVMSRTMPV
jgi:enoyl-[acyl-carrier-protein] reductase (NADH)